MAYTIPTPADLKLRFPAFSAVPDATVQAHIDDATKTVTQAWNETDYPLGIILLACHTMTRAGLGTGATAESYANGMAGYSSIRSGNLSLQRNATSQSGDDSVPSPWNGSTYGVDFYWLAKRNVPSAAIALATEVPGSYPYYYPYPMGAW